MPRPLPGSRHGSLPGPATATALALFLLCALPCAAQNRAELEIERRDRTLSRLEVYRGAVPVLRAERELEDDATQRLAVRIPGSAVGLDGFGSLFLEDGPGTTELGAALELGRGVPALGGSVEDGEDRFAGLYLRLRWPNLEIAGGGGARNDDFIQHGAVYVKGARWSAAVGGARGPNGVDFQHLAATWHPVQRGGAPGARLIAERRTSDRYFAELMFTDRASFNHFAVWGQYGITEWPHRKTFEAADDITRYVRPPIFLHGYTAGAFAMSARYQRTLGTRELTLDGRTFPVRFFRTAPAVGTASQGGVEGYFAERVLPSLMVGGFRRTRAKTTTWVGEIGLPPFSVYVELPTSSGAHNYVLVQYRQGL